MVRIVIGLLLMQAAVLAGPVLPCAPGTLVDYINLFSDGCSIGDKVFFDFTELTIPTGSTPIDSATIAVTPVDVFLRPELRFTVNTSAGPGEFLDTRFAYSVTSRAPVVGLTLQHTDALAAGDAAVTVIEDSCLGDVFSFDLCFATMGTPLITFATDFDELSSDRTSFAPVFTLGIANDIGVDAGLAGSAAIGSVINRIDEVPEPATGLLTALGLIAAALLRRRP